MAILESCCFWKNVRMGSFACAIYTLIYFGFSTLMFLFYLREEQEFLLGQRSEPAGESMLEKGDVTVVTVIFNVFFLFCSVLMVLSSGLMIVGLRRNKRQLLIPWICFMLADLLIECSHLIHLTLSRRVIFDPIVGFIFTIDFFILCLNLYCLLCVISQYQAYRAQRSEQQENPTTSPVVVFTAAEKLSKTQQQHQQQQLQHQAQLLGDGSGNGKRQSRRMLGAASPLITSQRLTNFSTITEEEEQQSRAGHSNGHLSDQPGSSVAEPELDMDSGNGELQVTKQIITLDSVEMAEIQH
ncbi:GL21059 [Drosophila persimilis]|uniref:GL21059 n=1 Tax=Drosophila persimilis TaxID=7234 RepID=B4HAV1_DROPE|nr:GL21059 [Drosophila persimilis]